jgi:hypothetical protein
MRLHPWAPQGPTLTQRAPRTRPSSRSRPSTSLDGSHKRSQADPLCIGCLRHPLEPPPSAAARRQDVDRRFKRAMVLCINRARGAHMRYAEVTVHKCRRGRPAQPHTASPAVPDLGQACRPPPRRVSQSASPPAAAPRASAARWRARSGGSRRTRGSQTGQRGGRPARDAARGGGGAAAVGGGLPRGLGRGSGARPARRRSAARRGQHLARGVVAGGCERHAGGAQAAGGARHAGDGRRRRRARVAAAPDTLSTWWRDVSMACPRSCANLPLG